VGGSATVTIVVTVTAAAAPSVTHTPSVSGNEPDASPGTNSASIVTSVTPASDLSVTVTPQGIVLPGANATLTLTATNNGPSAATGVTVFHTVPSTMGYVSASPSQGSCNQDSGTVICTLGSLASGASATVTLVETTSIVANVVASASVTANQADANLAN